MFGEDFVGCSFFRHPCWGLPVYHFPSLGVSDLLFFAHTYPSSLSRERGDGLGGFLFFLSSLTLDGTLHIFLLCNLPMSSNVVITFFFFFFSFPVMVASLFVAYSLFHPPFHIHLPLPLLPIFSIIGLVEMIPFVFFVISLGDKGSGGYGAWDEII